MANKESFLRFVVEGLGIYEAVDRDCPRDDLRRKNKPDGAWLPKAGEKFPGAISFWKERGLKTYFQSGLQEWHRSVVNGPLSVIAASRLHAPLYEDAFQLICRAEGQDLRQLSWEDYVAGSAAYPKVEKVVAYIVRDSGHGKELLVFEHDKQWSEAGIQVPAGTVDPGESLETAALREAAEECGLPGLTIVRKIDEYVLYRHTHQQFHHRHVFLLRAPFDTKAQWTQQVTGEGSDKGMRFHFSWIPLTDAAHVLAGSLGCSTQKAAHE